jgi:hypothetical protein
MFHTAGAKAFFAAWNALRTDKSIPHYRTVFQGLSSDLIPNLMILEEGANDSYIVRFMGTRFVELWGEDITGQDRTALMKPKVAAGGRSNMRSVLEQPCGLRNLGIYAMPSRSDLEIESVLLPAANDPGKPRRVLTFGQDVQLGLVVSKDQNQEIAEREWVDIGFGVPARRPAR